MANKILIINYGVGNHLSVENALKFLGYEFTVSGDIQEIKKATSYILPGVGAFAEAMKNLASHRLIEVLNQEIIENKKPILGICLGMQILADSSQEGGMHQGLGWIPGRIIKFDNMPGYHIPHVGWNTISIQKKEPLFNLIDKDASFYFDHSYHYQCDNQYVAAKTIYGLEFNSAVQKDNIFGVQFHPEKSQNNGLKLFRSFFNYVEGK